MRFSKSVLTLIATGFLTAFTKPHGHKLKHNHSEKRDQLLRILHPRASSPASHVKIVTVPGPTLLEFELNGRTISQTEACQGIKDGTLRFADGGYQSQLCLEHGISHGSPMSVIPPFEEIASHHFFFKVWELYSKAVPENR